MILAVSSCLLGNNVRFDGGHKRDRFITDLLSKYASFVSFCPEVLAFDAPRPSIRLVKKSGDFEIISNKTGENLTESLNKQNEFELDRIKKQKLSGIILKSKSPSCGFGSTKIYLPSGQSEGKTDGLFATLCKQHFPNLPIEEESRLIDPWLRENFIMHLFSYNRFENFKDTSPNMGSIVAFHTVNKFLLQSKSESHYRNLGLIVANHDKKSTKKVLNGYENLYKKAIAQKSSIKKTRNVLEHMAGFLKKNLGKTEKELLHLLIEDYANKLIPLITPISAINLLAHKHNISYLLEQTFLNPYPKDLALRSSLEAGK